MTAIQNDFDSIVDNCKTTHFLLCYVTSTNLYCHQHAVIDLNYCKHQPTDLRILPTAYVYIYESIVLQNY